MSIYDRSGAERERKSPSSRLGPFWPRSMENTSSSDPSFNDAHILIAAECAASVNADLYQLYRMGRVTLTVCPDRYHGDYTGKLTRIFEGHVIRSVVLMRLSVPCCDAMEKAVMAAREACGRDFPVFVENLTLDGKYAETPEELL